MTVAEFYRCNREDGRAVLARETGQEPEPLVWITRLDTGYYLCTKNCERIQRIDFDDPITTISSKPRKWACKTCATCMINGNEKRAYTPSGIAIGEVVSAILPIEMDWITYGSGDTH